jgi:MtaA/CmuA family methyltransferase
MADELIIDAIKGRGTERVPVAPIITLPHASKTFGVKPFEYILDSEKYAEAQINSRRFYNYDWVFAHQIFQGLTEGEKSKVKDMGDHFTLPLEIGTTFKIPKKGSPFIIGKAVTEKEGVKKLKVPDTFDPERLKPIQLMKKNEDFVSGNIRCPFTFAATYLYETEKFFMDLKMDEPFVKDLLDFALKYCLESGKAQIEAGVDAIFMEDPSASPNVISPEAFRKFALPRIKKLVRKMRKRVPVVLHICGDVSPIVDDMISTGVDCLSIDEIMDMKTVHKKIAVWGNIAPKFLVGKEPKEIRAISEEIIGIGDGVVLSSGCVVPGIAKPENIREMVSASHAN